jgi:hypothetical protein
MEELRKPQDSHCRSVMVGLHHRAIVVLCDVLVQRLPDLLDEAN